MPQRPGRLKRQSARAGKANQAGANAPETIALMDGGINTSNRLYQAGF